jgi:hypothetical protein
VHTPAAATSEWENRDHEFVSFEALFRQRKMQSKFELNDLDANEKLCQMRF